MSLLESNVKTLYAPPKPPFIDLVAGGAPRACVVAPAKAAPELRHAARELAAYVEKISGATLPVAEQAPADCAAVRLIVDPAFNPPAPGKRSWPGARGYRLLTCGKELRIIGADPLCVLHGVYGLLERHLGVRWFLPDDCPLYSGLGEVVPCSKTVRAGQLDETSVPDFPVRWVGSGAWALRNGANTMVGINGERAGVNWKWHFHTFATLIPASYHERHPEWWPLINGKRVQPDAAYTAGNNGQLCTSNPELVAEMTKNILAVLDAEPDIDVIALSPNDGGGFCECPQCRALDEGDRGWFGRYSRRIALFNNQVSAAIAEKHPNVLVKVGAYCMYLLPPLDETARPAPNQIVQLCHIQFCHNHPVARDGCVQAAPGTEYLPNSEFRRLLEEWRKIAPHLFVYEYAALSGPGLANLFWPMAHTLRADMPYYRSLGVEGFYTQTGYAHGPAADQTFYHYGLNYYLAAKLAWNAGLDVDLLMRDYCDKFYGPASGPMLRYYRRLERAMVEDGRCISYGLQGYGAEGALRWGREIFTPAILEELDSLISEAETLAAGSNEQPYAGRVALARRAFNEARRQLNRSV